MHNSFQNAARIALAIALASTVATPAVAWTGPTAAPPGGVVPATPVNTSATAQTKTGYFNLNLPSTSNNWGMQVSGGQYGVYGQGISGPGLEGISTNQSGVYGQSSNAQGVYGYSTNNWGGYFTGGSGAYGQGTTGVGVQGYNGNGNNWGGYFTGGYGVYSSNTAGYYTELDNSSWGLLTNGNTQAAGQVQAGNGGGILNTNGDIYMSYYGTWLSSALGWNGSFYNRLSGGGFEYLNGGPCWVGNQWTGGCSCPGFAPYGRQINVSYYNSSWYEVTYLCEGV